MPGLYRIKRAHLALAHDVMAAAGSFLTAFYLRVGDAISLYPLEDLLWRAGLLAVIAGAVFSALGLYRGLWRYASLSDLLAILRAAFLTILIFVVVDFALTRGSGLPRSLPVINWFVLVAFLGAARFSYRLLKDGRLRPPEAAAKRVPILLIGAGDSAETFIRDLNRDPESNYEVVGVITDQAHMAGRTIHGVPVLGQRDEIESAVARLSREGKRPRRLVLAERHTSTEDIRELLRRADGLGMTLARLPRLTEFHSNLGKDGAATRDTGALAPIAIEDILGRPQRVLDREAMAALIAGKRVLVTGAGGTIGGELARQIADFAPARLDLLDHGEFALYTIAQELRQRRPHLPIVEILGNVRNRQRINGLIAHLAPEIVFHAAALKHVPIVEAEPEEGVLTNVIGSRNVADACRAHGVALMVQISTDKVVAPTSVMGASKRLAEAYCQALDIAGAGAGEGAGTGERGSTRFVTVRFGNVLGSTGSVVPLFQKQLASGGPLTVTHPEVKRYFMTVREAVELVLEAAALATSDNIATGKIFVLEMGEPIRIAELARQMVRLAGLRPDHDIKIVYTGLRPGEKLYEDLFHGEEAPVPTRYDGVRLAAPRILDPEALGRALTEMENAARAGNRSMVLDLLREWVPDYIPDRDRKKEAAKDTLAQGAAE